ncbi:hypothetical protein AB0E75_26415 [Streptomyces griseoviridis]|jgi:hypothetical protein|uniref:Uncharacterized protein n=3 Tax=Streptomyces TaxID=1883 RepID=A0ABT9L9K9_STRGD|nr:MULTISPECIES: hypothetical protein [Streptomyces]MDP9679970.1 hypothetical protein [Streptomyces griseoviridis]GGS48125.1 hypothetical protein GCM10010238_42210 [Streptomyces niveoruber]GGT04688.1 hypothetical protein GCM10010240_42440 [Streptomyces griseoviridis]GGU56537.1 hypothetical protein GCM10010259_54460 [Streptomyces daghestanicus]GHI29525.1 hypothetical protein Sdagh_12550 [Streptomyces daghestanicus]
MSDTQLTVTLDGGGIEDARAVVRALEGVFGAPDDLPADERATVRTATFSSSSAPEPSGAPESGGGRLSAPVTVTVQGTPQAVAAASETLARAFTTSDEGAASGDQEQERELHLVP